MLGEIETIDKLDFFMENEPRGHLDSLIHKLAPIFDRIFDSERIRIEQLFFTETRKIKNLDDMRREEKQQPR